RALFLLMLVHVLMFMVILMILWLPRSTLFPYTTLFRSRHDPARSVPTVERRRRRAGERQQPVEPRRLFPQRLQRDDHGAGHHHRSEEHTSELQSRENLVCRLLLEKKKQGLGQSHFSYDI